MSSSGEGAGQAAHDRAPGDDPAALEEALRALPRAAAEALYRRAVGPVSGDREALPWRREGTNRNVRVGGRSLYLHTGEFEDGRLGEIFIRVAKDGDTEGAVLNCFAIAVSIGLQHGVPLEAYVRSFLFTRFGAQGLVQGDDEIKAGTSLIDYVFRRLAIDYLDRRDLVQGDADEGVTR